MRNNLLEIRNLLIEAEIEGAWKSIVNGLSLNLQKGEIVGLIGESGAGKSTLGLAALPGAIRRACSFTENIKVFNARRDERSFC